MSEPSESGPFLDDEPLVPHVHFLDEREGRPINPNTPEGELRNMAAFAAGVSAAPPHSRMYIKLVVWLLLLGIALAILAGVLSGVRTF